MFFKCRLNTKLSSRVRRPNPDGLSKRLSRASTGRTRSAVQAQVVLPAPPPLAPPRGTARVRLPGAFRPTWRASRGLRHLGFPRLACTAPKVGSGVRLPGSRRPRPQRPPADVHPGRARHRRSRPPQKNATRTRSLCAPGAAAWWYSASKSQAGVGLKQQPGCGCWHGTATVQPWLRRRSPGCDAACSAVGLACQVVNLASGSRTRCLCRLAAGGPDRAMSLRTTVGGSLSPPADWGPTSSSSVLGPCKPGCKKNALKVEVGGCIRQQTLTFLRLLAWVRAGQRAPWCAARLR